MNFISTFDELNKLYEEVEHEEEVVEEACAKEALTEAAEDDEIEIVDDEAPVEGEAPVEEPIIDEPKQLILECDKCGALVIKNEADIVADEESDLVNVEDECQFCEEAKGYKIIGVMMPYEAGEETIEEEASESEDTETAEEISESSAAENSDDKTLSEYYDEECPQGRYTPYVSDPVKPWENSAPKWWKDKGGTDASWKNRPRTDYKHDEETGEYRPR